MTFGAGAGVSFLRGEGGGAEREQPWQPQGAGRFGVRALWRMAEEKVINLCNTPF